MVEPSSYVSGWGNLPHRTSRSPRRDRLKVRHDVPYVAPREDSMRNAKVIAAALALVLAASCKKKTQDTGDKMGSGSSAMGSGSSEMGSGSSAMGSGSADMGSAGSGSAAPEPPKAKEAKNMPASEMKWGPLDPSAGDKGPQSAGP